MARFLLNDHPDFVAWYWDGLPKGVDAAGEVATMIDDVHNRSAALEKFLTERGRVTRQELLREFGPD